MNRTETHHRIGKTGGIVAILLALLTGLVLSASAQAATGDKIAQFTAADPNGCFVDGYEINTGIAFDGSKLLLTCWNDNHVDFVNATNGADLGSVAIAGADDLGAAAWDGKRNKLWVCNNESEVWLVNIADGTGSKQFDSEGCIDGLAYDGSDDTIWASDDATCNGPQHYTPTGTLIGDFNVCSPIDLLGGSGNSGIAVGGPDLFLGNNGGSQVWRAPKTLDSSTLFFNNVDDTGLERRVEDLECDNVTFAGEGKQAMWVQDAYDRLLKAVEIEPNLCGFGGLPPAAPAVAATPAPAPVVAKAKPTAKAGISGPRGCTRASATVRVSGQNIATVTYSLDGKKVKKAKGNKTSVKVNLKRAKSGIHRISARVTYTAATAAKAQTKHFSVSRCARQAAKPKFTG